MMSDATLKGRVQQSSRRRRDEGKAALRASMLAAAGELLVERGYQDFSLRQVAERIGFTATTIYRYFANKDELVFAVTDEGFRVFGDRLRAAAADESDPFVRIAALGRAYVDFGVEHPVYYRLMFMERPDYLLGCFDGRREARIATFQVLRDAVDAAIATGETRIVDGEVLSNVLWAQVHGITALAITMPFLTPDAVRAMTDAGVELSIAGLRR